MGNDTCCEIEGCEEPRHARGWCLSHYGRWRKHGNPLGGRQPAEIRLWAGATQADGGCLEWTGNRLPKGYGLISYQGRSVTTHRLAFQLANGSIPAGMYVCHACDNPPCINPAHLFLGSPKGNMADKVAKGRASNGRAERTHCPKGHPYDEHNTYRRPSGGRACRECSRASSRAAYKRRQ